MKTSIEKRKPDGVLDYIALVITTFGVGYLPLAPGTWGSAVGVAVYAGVTRIAEAVRPVESLAYSVQFPAPQLLAVISIAFLLFCLLGVWSAGRSTELLGDLDPSQAVVDEVIGQLIVFLFVPFGVGWPIILAGFLLFRLFDIWKPYPIDYLQNLPAGIGVCADDILAGIYAGICLSVIYAVSLSI